MIIKKIFILLLLLFTILLNSQELPKLQYTPKTPEVELMYRFQDIPVGMFTGTTNLNVPIHSISTGGLNEPISLSYHSGGNKVSDKAPWTGLGWRLNAGGIITREIRGVPDDLSQGVGFLVYRENNEYVDLVSPQGSNCDISQVWDQLLENCQDSEPDLFRFDVNGLQGQFGFDWDGGLKFQCDRDVKITYELDNQVTNGSRINKFTIVDDIGNKYIFEDIEVTNPLNVSVSYACSAMDYNSAWRLSRMEDHSGNHVITYSYSSYLIPNNFVNDIQRHIYLEGNGPQTSVASGNNFETTSLNISQINVNNGEQIIDFIKDTSVTRTDVTGNPHPLGNIRIKNVLGNVVNEYQFTYDFNNRLKLIDINRIANGLIENYYEFEYDQTDLPFSYESKSIDHWGYYNGANNSVLYPSYKCKDLCSLGECDAIVIQGADRTPNFQYGKAGILTKVTYPTGGYSSFEYEPHDYHITEELEVPNDQTGLVTLEAHGTSNAGELIEDSQTFTVLEEQFGCPQLNIIGRNVQEFGQFPGGFAPYLELRDSQNEVIFTYVVPYTHPQSSGTNVYIDKILSPGTYTMTVRTKNIIDPEYPNIDNFIEANYSWSGKETITNIENKILGGVRIKSITEYDTDDTFLKKKSYVYRMADDASKSSGSVGAEPYYIDYNYINVKNNPNCNVTPNTCAYTTDTNLTIYTGSLRNLNSSFGHVEYANVYTEVETATNDILKSNYSYTSRFDYGNLDNISFEKPYTPLFSVAYRRGLLKEETHYKHENGTFTPRLKTTYEYDYHNELIKGIKAGMKVTGYKPWCTPTSHYAVQGYHTNFGQSKLIEKNTTHYYPEGNFVTTEKWSYENNLRRLYEVIAMTSKNNKEYRTRYSYADSEAIAPYNTMVSNNMIAIPIKEEYFFDNELLTTLNTDYDFAGNNFILPKEIKSQKYDNNGSQEETRLLFNQYDEKGNPLEVQENDGTTNVMLWGYNRSLPIAKIVNTTYNEVITNLGNTNYLQSLTDDALEHELNSKLRVTMPNSYVSTYIHNPLVGVTQTTDPRNYRQRYVFDDFNRLYLTKDADGYILSQNLYEFYDVNTQIKNHTINHVFKTSYLESELNTIEDDDIIKMITYFDGLGRKVQNINKYAGGNKEDIIKHKEYDVVGRSLLNFLPYADINNSDSFRVSARTATEAYHQNKFSDDFSTIVNPYTEVAVETSPLALPTEQGAPGSDWKLDNNSDNDHTIKFEYGTNQSGEVRFFDVNFINDITSEPELVFTGTYPKTTLHKKVTKDENWQPTDGKAKTTEEFTNKSGQIVLKRTYTKENGQDIAHDSYYIYDDFGNLTYVLSPKASDAILITPANTIDTQVLDDLGYQYKYDFRNRLIEKKIPGKGWESIVYDRLDRPVLTQDPNLQAQGKWLFTKYDVLGRVTYTGMYTSAQTRAQLQTTVNAITTGFNESRVTTPINYTDVDVYYSNDAFPNTNIEVLTVNYYDDYNFGNSDVLVNSTTVTDIIGVTQVNNVYTRTNGSYGWNAGVTTDGVLTGNGYVEHTITSSDKRVILGLTTAAPSQYNFMTFNYSMYTGYSGDNYIRLYENGTQLSIPITTYAVGDKISISRTGDQIYYQKNGETFFQSSQTNTQPLVGKVSFHDPGATSSNLHLVHSVSQQPITTNTQGLATGSVVRVLETDKFIHTITQYDEKARAIYMASKNEYLDTHDVVTNTYDFVGNVLETITSHTKNGVAYGTVGAVTTKDAFTYDHQNRLLTHTQTINNSAPEVLVENHYDELGQLVQKKTGVTTHTVHTETTNLHRVIREGNRFSKIFSEAFDGNIETVAQIPSGKNGYVEFTISEHEKRSMVGLSDPTEPLGNGYAEIDYAIYTGYGVNKRVLIYEEGSSVTIPYTTFEAGDTFRVARIGSTISYQKNGIEFHSTTTNVETGALIGDVSLFAFGDYLKDLKLVIVNPDAGQSLQTVDYAYNVRGWLKQINDPNQSLTNDLFAFKINYNTAETSLGAQKLYNGNISETLWRTASDDELHAYGYTYDALNRIASANYAQGNTHNVNTGFYSLNSISYDKNGNILALQRNGADATHTSAVSIDDLVYGYADNSNKLTRVTDSTVNVEGFNDNYQNSGSDPADNDYLYDANGNMILDKNKYITGIEYNHLNLPTKVTFSNQTGGSAANTIEYIYDATGIKQEKLVTTDYGSNVEKHGTQYAGNYVYSGADTNGQGYFFYGLTFFNHPEGYIEPYLAKGTTLFRYTYQHKDHLGNIRVAYADYDNDGKIDIVRSNGAGNVDVDGDGDLENEIVQAKNYYPFGMEHNYGNTSPMSVVNGRDHEWAFANEEFDEEFGRNTVNYQWRDYDPAIGKFNRLDRFSEKYYNLTPYGFAGNNPIAYRDVQGDSISEGSQKNYDKLKRKVTKVRDKLQSKINKINSKASRKGWSSQERANALGDMEDRLTSLNTTLSDFAGLESSTQFYRLEKNDGLGDTSYDPATGEIVISYSSDALGVHELVHGAQFETGDIGFNNTDGNSQLQDLGDERRAYQAQYAFNPSSVTGLSSTSSINSFGDITNNWVQGITLSNGSRPYGVGGSANTGIVPINVNSTMADLARAYPQHAQVFGQLPATRQANTLPTLYYKQ